MSQGDPRDRGRDTEPEQRDLRYGLEEALDGELPRELVERMQRHTDDCSECAEEWEQVRRIKELVRRSCADQAPSDLRERIAVQCRSVSTTHTSTTRTSVTSTSTTSTEPDGTSVRITRTSSVRREFPAP